MSERKIKGFKKFSNLESNDEGLDLGINPMTDSDRPMIPNLPKETTKREIPKTRKPIIPKDREMGDDSEILKEDVLFYGKVSKFPKGTKAHKAFNFLENVKVSKNTVWYILVEKQDNELQMVKYNNREGFDLSKFVLELKGFYIKKWVKIEPRMAKLIESIEVKGADEFSVIKNIPNIDIEPGKKLITRITEDLIRLLN
jgi:hypothetical protein